jgi:SAM-dependent methyltransferase
MPPTPSPPVDPVPASLSEGIARVCGPLLRRVAGTHALVVDGAAGAAPAAEGVGRWTMLWPDAATGGWCGQVSAERARLPFGDGAFCTVVVRFAGGAGVAPEACAPELARVLAPHGLLLVAELHPRSLWRPEDPALRTVPPQRWVRALYAAGLQAEPPHRCGAPWPRAAGESGLPGWLVRYLGGAYVLEARKRTLAGIVLRTPPAAARTIEHRKLVPGAHRLRA